jgi:hypothetical protein
MIVGLLGHVKSELLSPLKRFWMRCAGVPSGVQGG